MMATNATTVAAWMTIAGAAEEALRGDRYDVRNPADGSIVGTAALGAPVDAARAVGAAIRAFPVWHEMPVAERAGRLSESLGAVAAHAHEIAVLITREEGKPLQESLDEVAGFLDRMRAMIVIAQTSKGGEIPLWSARQSGHAAEPNRPGMGVTAALVAWNFPVGLMAKKIGPALLAGGTVVLKPAFTTPLASSRVIQIMNASALPAGVLNCVTGRGQEVGEALVSDPRVRRIHLTGSEATARRIGGSVGSADAELVLELSGSNPMIVCADASWDGALNAAVVGRFRNAGQVCTAVKRLYVATEIYEDFVRELRSRIALLEPGDGLIQASAPRTRIGPVHAETHRAKLEEQLADALHKGAEVLIGGRRPAHAHPRGHFLEPTLVAGAPCDCKLVTEEVFGPVLPVFRTTSLEDAIAQANQSPWELGASIWTADYSEARRARRSVRSREFWINQLRFGGDRPAANGTSTGQCSC